MRRGARMAGRLSAFALLDHLPRMYTSESNPSSETANPLLLQETHGGPFAHYSAYGLIIRSEIPLPEFHVVNDDDQAFDASVVYGAGDDWIDPVRHERSHWSIGSGEARFWFQGVAGF